ncbi:MAG TPA: hypothetical protein VIK89_04490 [Cytophagaceae bacterium]
MRVFFFIIYLLLITPYSGMVFAQQENSDEPTVVVTYTKTNGNSYKKREHNIYNLIKVNPILIVNGDMPIYFERRLNDQISIEAAVGVTYMNYIYESFKVETQGQYIEERNALPGYSASGSIKFYPSTYTSALEDFYFGLEARYRHYRSEALDNSTSSLRGYVPEYRKIIDSKITFGYITYLSDRVIADFYAGFGMRKRDYARAYYTNENGYTETVYETTNDLIPVISAGIKIGFGF